MSALKKADEVRTFPTLVAFGGPGNQLVKKLPTKNNPIRDVIRSGQTDKNVLPGILKTSKPPVSETKNAEGEKLNTFVGFLATNVKFDGNSIDVPDQSSSTARERQQQQQQDEPRVSEIDLNSQGFLPDGPGDAQDTMAMVKKLKFKKDPVMEELRNYITLMDRYSLHNFVIYEGKTLRDTPEFESFQRSYIQVWGTICSIVLKLEQLLSKYEIKLAIINGPKLFTLASLSPSIVTQEDLLDCISNIEQILPIINSLGSATRNNTKMRAVLKMQSCARKFLAIRRCKALIKRINSATKIQSIIRLFNQKMRLRATRLTTRSILDDRWKENREKLNRIWRSETNTLNSTGNNTSNNNNNPAVSSRGGGGGGGGGVGVTGLLTGTATVSITSEKLVIHIPSTSAAEYLRLNMDSLPALENANISVLYQLCDPTVHMLYVVPFPLSASEQAYYDKFLSVLNIATFPKRLHFVVPELVHRMPQHMALSHVLWNSSKALTKIRGFIRRYSTSFIVASSPGWAEKRISNYLNTPILSPDPKMVETMQSRSFAKKLFSKATINVPIGAHDIHTEDDFLIALSRLITSNMDVQRWIFRLNRDYNGESVCYLNVSKLTIMEHLREEMESIITRNNNNPSVWFARATQLAVRKKLMLDLREQLGMRVQICRTDIYSTWEMFLRVLKVQGGVIEAEPLEKLGVVEGMAFIDPLGGIQCCGGVDVIQDKSYQSQAYLYPQTYLPKAALTGAMTAFCQYLFEKHDVIGYITVNFTAFWDSLDNIPRLWGKDVNFGFSSVMGNLGSAALASCNKITYLPKSLIPNMPEDRCWCYMPTVTHRPLRTSRDDVFFKFCKMRGIAFDLHEKTGTLFHLVDAIVGGVVSISTIATTREKSVAIAITTLSFIAKQFGKESYGGSARRWSDLQEILLQLKKIAKNDSDIAKRLFN